jgi:two-component system response regulator DegU
MANVLINKGDKAMNKFKILLADDHEGFRRILTSFLKMQERVESVDEAIDGQDVIEKVEMLRPDLIFMDIHMPKQNGIEAMKIIKTRWPSTRVFILSMDANEFYRKNAREYADGFIAKSSMKDALKSILSGNKEFQPKSAEMLDMVG